MSVDHSSRIFKLSIPTYFLFLFISFLCRDWGPIGIVHARMGAQRALENGFTLFRCSSGGVSGVYDAYGNVLTETILGTKANDVGNAALSYTARIPILPRVSTLYSVLGDSLGILCLSLWILAMALVVVDDSLIRRFHFLVYILKPQCNF